MAQIYESDATLTIDGSEQAVRAQVSVYGDGRGAKSWFGGLSPASEALAWQLLNARTATITLEDGRQGEIRASGRSDGECVGFVGSGPPPN